MKAEQQLTIEHQGSTPSRRPAGLPTRTLCPSSGDEACRKVEGSPINPDLAVLQGREAELARLGSGDGDRDAG